MKVYFIPRMAGISDMITQVKRMTAIGELFGFEVAIVTFPNGRVSPSLDLSALLIGGSISKEVINNIPVMSVNEFAISSLGDSLGTGFCEAVVRSSLGNDVSSLYYATGARISRNTYYVLSGLFRRGLLYQCYKQRLEDKPVNVSIVSIHLRLGDTAIVAPSAVAWHPDLCKLLGGKYFFAYDSGLYSSYALLEHFSAHSFLKRFACRPSPSDYVDALSKYLKDFKSDKPQLGSGSDGSGAPDKSPCVVLNSDGYTLAANRLAALFNSRQRDGLLDPGDICERLSKYYLHDITSAVDRCNLGEDDQSLVEAILNALLADVVLKSISAFPLDLREVLMIPPPLTVDVTKSASDDPLIY